MVYEVQISFFLKTADQFARELSLSIHQKEKHLEEDLNNHRTWLMTQLPKNHLSLQHAYIWYPCQTGKGLKKKKTTKQRTKKQTHTTTFQLFPLEIGTKEKKKKKGSQTKGNYTELKK